MRNEKCRFALLYNVFIKNSMLCVRKAYYNSSLFTLHSSLFHEKIS